MSRFAVTEEQEMLLELVQELVKAEIRPRAEKIDHEALYPVDGIAILAQSGLIACGIPENYDGSGLDHWSQAAVIEEIAKECASTAWAAAAIAEMAECLLKYGTEEQKKRILPGLAAGELAVGAERSGVKAEETEAEFILNGKICNIPFAGACAWYLIPAAFDEEQRWFLLEGSTPGLSAEDRPQKLGMKGCGITNLILENCSVKKDMQLKGDAAALLRDSQSLNMAAIAAGIAEGALEEAIQYVNQRVQFGKKIAEFENTQHVIAELLAKTAAASALVRETAALKDSSADYGRMAAMAKLAASDTAAVTGRKCVQLMGGYGYSREYPVERKMRDAKMTELYGGTSAKQKNLIAKEAVLL